MHMGKERVALVTGSMGGLGAALGRAVHDMGMTVAVTYSTHDDHVATWLRDERDSGRHFHAYEVDIAE